MFLDEIRIGEPAEAHKGSGARMIYIRLSTLHFTDWGRTTLSFTFHFTKIAPVESLILYCLQDKLKMTMSSIRKLGININQSVKNTMEQNGISINLDCWEENINSESTLSMKVKDAFMFTKSRINQN